MNIWIDGKEANVLQRLGSSQVAFELLKNIHNLDSENNYTILLSSKPLNDLPKERLGWKYKILKPGRLWTRVAVPIYYHLAKVKPDVIFSPTHYIPRFIKVKRVPVIFDLAFIHFPEMFKKDDLYKLTNWTKTSVLESAHIITISESSKKDILETYKVPSAKVTVAYPGYNDQIFKVIKDPAKQEKILEKYQIKGEYIIYIGTVQPRKNLLRLIRSMKKITHPSSGSEDLKLVIAGKIKGKGKQGWMNEEILEEPKKLGIEDKIIFTDYIPPEELPYLITGSKAFILPSLWEGFGIPILEAMACGVPVITSNVSSLPEVAGDAGLLINPKSETQIEQAIRLLVTDKKLHDKLSKKALEQSKKFSWQKMAKEVIKVLEFV